MNKLFSILLLILGTTSLFAQSGTDLVLVNGNVIDVEEGRVLENVQVLIRDSLIVEIGSSVDIPERVRIVDVKGKWLVPGLVDAHIHFFQSGGIYTRPDALDLRKYVPYSEEIAQMKEDLPDTFSRYLANGITTVIDAGGPMYNFTIRDSVARQYPAPHIYITGPLVATWQPEAFRIKDPPIIEVTSGREAFDVIEKQLPHKPDFIKIWYIARDQEEAEQNYPVIAQTITEAHQQGLLVAVHATQLETARLAVRAGANFLVHSVDDQVVDQDFINMLVRNEVVYCPTLVVSGNYGYTFMQEPDLWDIDFERANPHVIGSLFDLQKYPEGRDRINRMKQIRATYLNRISTQDSIMRINLKKLHDAGVRIATGTDAGNIGTLHATSYWHELDRMQKAGISNAAILRASTINGAFAMAQENAFGSLTPGKRADMLILNKNPLENLEALRDMDLMVLNGKVIRPDTLVKSTPEDLAEQQLIGYNARNIEAFLAPYSDSVEVYDLGGNLQYRGKANMKKLYEGMFSATPDLYCDVVNRIVQGNTVIDQERVQVRKGAAPVEAIAIYRIQNNKIQEVYFISDRR